MESERRKLVMERFPSIAPEELEVILKNKDAKNTLKAMDVAFNVFQSYCTEKNITFNPESINKQDMDNILVKFYVECCKVYGEMYKKNSFISLRAGIQRKMLNYQGCQCHVSWLYI